MTTLATEILSRPPSCGPVRLVAVDGPAGSGKTTLALRLGEELGAQVVRSDDFPVPWEGGPGGWFPALAEAVLTPLSEGRPGTFRRYDWHAGRFADLVLVPPAPVVVVEGVGTARRSVSGLLAYTIWVEAPEPVRWARVIERDGPGLEERWRAWFAAERAWFAEDGTRERADAVVVTG